MVMPLPHGGQNVDDMCIPLDTIPECDGTDGRTERRTDLLKRYCVPYTLHTVRLYMMQPLAIWLTCVYRVRVYTVSSFFILRTAVRKTKNDLVFRFSCCRPQYEKRKTTSRTVFAFLTSLRMRKLSH